MLRQSKFFMLSAYSNFSFNEVNKVLKIEKKLIKFLSGFFAKKPMDFKNPSGIPV